MPYINNKIIIIINIVKIIILTLCFSYFGVWKTSHFLTATAVNLNIIVKQKLIMHGN